MTDLTEQWKKGEFIICNAGKCQYYYVQNEEQREVIKTEYCLFDDNTPNWQILAPVPSYKEWVGVKQQRDLENKLRHDSDNKNWQLRTENTQLKELLKECKPYFDALVEKRLKLEYIPQVNKLLTKIDEVLK